MSGVNMVLVISQAQIEKKSILGIPGKTLGSLDTANLLVNRLLVPFRPRCAANTRRQGPLRRHKRVFLGI